MTETEKAIKKISQYATKHGLDLREFAERVGAAVSIYTPLSEALWSIRRTMENERYERNMKLACQALAQVAKDTP
jgi:hypothetical protein